MTGAPTVYRSDAREVVGEWADTQRRYREWHQSVAEFKARFPGRDAIQYRSGDRVYMEGLAGDDAPGPEWRRDKRRGCWVANKRTAAGKLLDAEIRALRVVGLGKLPGMPSNVWALPSFFSHGVHELDGVLFVTWGDKVSYDDVERQPSYDEALWRRAKASEFYAAVEAVDA